MIRMRKMRKLTDEKREMELSMLYGRFQDAIDHTVMGITDKEILAVFNDVFEDMKAWGNI